MLTETERMAVERRLLEEREQAVAAVEEFVERSGTSLQEQAGELSVYRFHMADLGSEAEEREKQFLLASKEGERVYAIDTALRRLYSAPEEFGRCERCGRGIGLERLLVVPEARLCADCQRAAEAVGAE